MISFLRIALTAAIVVTPFLHAQSPASAPSTQPEVSFDFTRPGLPVPHFLLRVHEDGSATYQAEDAPVSTARYGNYQPTSAPAVGAKVDRPLTISSATTATIFKSARDLNHFNLDCETKIKNIANTGKKTFTYSGPDGNGTCTFNYSDNKAVMQLTDTFQAIAYTLDEGRKLEHLHRFDRLGLDAEMEVFTHEYEEKRALELASIAPTLTSLVRDEALMDRVRKRASHLLEAAGQ
jgi:hypothetical protein